MTGLRQWFAGLSLREKWLIAVAAVLAVIVVIWFGIIRPVSDGLAAARARHAGAVLRLAETQARLDAMQPLIKAGPAPLSAPLDTVLRESAASAGLEIASITPQPSGNGVAVAVQKARPASLFGWVGTLEAQGIVVDQLTTTDNGDQTVAVQLTVRARGA